MSKEVIYTDSIPQCPYCEKPTRRTQGISMTTGMHYPPIYDENGDNINPDRNIKTTDYVCCECNKEYLVRGNYTDGFTYVTSY